MTPEAPIDESYFSEGPVVPRRLDYSESPSLIDKSEELKRLETSSTFLKALGMALFLLIRKYAR